MSEEQIKAAIAQAEAAKANYAKEAAAVEAEVKAEVSTDAGAGSPVEIESLAKHEPTVEEQARLQGWTPLEEFTARGKSKEEWRDAKHFLENGENWKKQANLVREIKELREQYKTLVEGQSELQKIEYQRAYNDIMAQKARIQASPNPNFQDYDRVAQQEAELKQRMAQTQQNQVPAEVEFIKNSNAWAKFTILNPWLNKDDADSLYLKTVAQKITAEMPIPKNEEETDKMLTILHNKIHKDYGHIVSKGLPVRPKTMPVTYSSGGAKDGSSYEHLNAAEKGAMAYLESQVQKHGEKKVKEMQEAFLKSLPKKK